MKSDFRADIQGLRVAAVFAVLANHLSGRLLPSGYLGVDVFFVVSGFVITGSLVAHRDLKLLPFLKAFYVRRVRRLFPALAVCVAATAMAFSLLSTEASQHLPTGLLSLAGLSNLQLYLLHADYFAAPIETNPFMHTWSLGVEEQFYLLYPLVVWAFFAANLTRMQASLLLVGATLLSLLAYVALARHPVATFYLMPFRFWEMSSGAALWFLNQGTFELSRRVRNLAAVVAAIGIAALFFLARSSDSPWPNVVTVALTIVVIGSRSELLATISSPRSIQFLGDASYSIYLWHWPVISIGKMVAGRTLFSALCETGLTLLLATISYRFVERPFRQAGSAQQTTNPSASGVWPAVALSTLAAATVVVALASGDRIFSGRRPVLERVGSASLIESYRVPGTAGSIWSGVGCVLTSDEDVGKVIDATKCTLAKDGASGPKVLVVGNSFSVAMISAFDELVKRGYRVVVTSSWGASPIDTVNNISAWQKANAFYWNETVPQHIGTLNRGDWIFLVSDLADFAIQASPSESARAAVSRRQFQIGIGILADRVESEGVRIAVLSGLPFAREAHCTPLQAVTQWFQIHGPPCTFYPRDASLERLAPLHSVLKAVHDEKHVVVVDLFDLFCPSAACTYEGSNRTNLYRDEYSHPSIEAGRLAAPVIAEKLGAPPVEPGRT